MKLLFPEEWALVQSLSEEWRREVVGIISELRDIFEGKGKERDKFSVIWQRMAFPEGILTIIDQKTERMQPLFALFHAGPTPPQLINWPKIIEECIDVASYWIFLAAIATMFLRRQRNRPTSCIMFSEGDEP